MHLMLGTVASQEALGPEAAAAQATVRAVGAVVGAAVGAAVGAVAAAAWPAQ